MIYLHLLEVAGRQKQDNGVSHFLVWGLCSGVSVANTATQTWLSVQQRYSRISVQNVLHCPKY